MIKVKLNYVCKLQAAKPLSYNMTDQVYSM